MVIKSYSVTLEEEVVKKAKEKMETGQKLSPIINDLLKKWTKEEEKKEV